MAGFRIDELARQAGTTVRNVRAYQDRGLLPSPRREGRIAWYDEGHLARLRLIASLLERGYTLANIAELLDAWEEGQDLAQLLGLESTLMRPWSDETPRGMTLGELREMFGPELDGPAIARAERLGLLVATGDGFEAPRPGTLRAGAELVAAGVPLGAVLDVAERLQEHVDEIARQFVEAVEHHVVGEEPPRRPEGIATLDRLVNRLRPLARAAVTAELASALERRISARLSDHVARAGEQRPHRAS